MHWAKFSICFLHLPLAQVWFFPPRTAAQIHLSWFVIKTTWSCFYQHQAPLTSTSTALLQNRAKQPHSPQLPTGKHRKPQTSAMPWVQAVLSAVHLCLWAQGLSFSPQWARDAAATAAAATAHPTDPRARSSSFVSPCKRGCSSWRENWCSSNVSLQSLCTEEFLLKTHQSLLQFTLSMILSKDLLWTIQAFCVS